MATKLGDFDAGIASFQSEEFFNTELISGDTPHLVTDGPETVPENTDWPAFCVVGRNGDGVLAMANAAGALIGDAGGVVASGALTFTNVGVADETITIGDEVYTLVAVPADPNDVMIGASATETAANLRDAINADPDAIEAGTVGPGTVAHPDVVATSAAGVVTVRANAPGTAGNAIASTETSTVASWGAATLAGGTDVGGGGITPLGITTAPVTTGAGVETTIDIFRAGCFNPDALVWDDSFNTDARKRNAFEGAPSPTNIVIRKIKYGAVYP